LRRPVRDLVAGPIWLHSLVSISRCDALPLQPASPEPVGSKARLSFWESYLPVSSGVLRILVLSRA